MDEVVVAELEKLKMELAELRALVDVDPFIKMPRIGPNILDRNNIGEQIYRDQIGRPGSAFGLWLATIQASRLGINKLQVFEFGVAHGWGLINLCKICELITASTDIQFEIFGFDSDVGMPPLVDYRDHPEIWYEGEFKSDHEWIRSQLTPNAQLISGNIKQTLPTFVADRVCPESPIGFVIIDVDLYSSTVDCFELLAHPDPDCYLPTSIVYMDDVNDLITLNSWCGEKLAISEFNVANSMRKLEELRVRKNHPRAGWHSHMYGLHVLDHRARRGLTPGRALDINITAI